MDGINSQLLASLSSVIVGLLYWSLNRNIAALDKEIGKLAEHSEDCAEDITSIRERVIILEQHSKTRR